MSTGKCKLICMAFDGDYVTERFMHEEYFDSTKEAWKHVEDMGSKWYFYPFVFVTSPSGTTIRDTPDELEFLKGKRVQGVKAFFEMVSALPEAQAMDIEEFISLLYTIWQEKKAKSRKGKK